MAIQEGVVKSGRGGDRGVKKGQIQAKPEEQWWHPNAQEALKELLKQQREQYEKSKHVVSSFSLSVCSIGCRGD